VKSVSYLNKGTRLMLVRDFAWNVPVLLRSRQTPLELIKRVFDVAAVDNFHTAFWFAIRTYVETPWQPHHTAQVLARRIAAAMLDQLTLHLLPTIKVTAIAQHPIGVDRLTAG
jgi:hypothetical protein